MPAESFGQVDAVEDGEESEPVYSEPYHVYASCEHIYETVEEALFARMETQPQPPEIPSLSEDAVQLRKMRSAPIPRRVSRRRSFVLERESASLLLSKKGSLLELWTDLRARGHGQTCHFSWHMLRPCRIRNTASCIAPHCN